MNTNQTIYFTCPHCEERFAQIEEPDRDVHTGETYHCGECGVPGHLPGAVHRGVRPATQGEKGLLLLQPRTLQVRPINIDRP